MEEYETFSVPALFDAHVHFRQGDNLRGFVRQTAMQCDRAVIMPNTTPALTNADLLTDYAMAVRRAIPEHLEFKPLFTLYLTPQTTPEEIADAKKALGESLVGVKLYPAGGTTNSGYGVPVHELRRLAVSKPLQDIPARFVDTLRAIGDNDLVLNVHGEDPTAELLDREASFIESRFLDWYVAKHMGARVVLEHVTTRHGVNKVFYLRSLGHKVAATITLHHLLMTVDDAYGQVHNTCWPPPNLRDDRSMLRRAASGLNTTDFGNPFFLGSDTAPHLDEAKYQPKCACGCFTAPVLVQRLMEFFPKTSFPTLLPAFASEAGAAFYGPVAAPSGRRLQVLKRPWEVPLRMPPGLHVWSGGTPCQYWHEACGTLESLSVDREPAVA